MPRLPLLSNCRPGLSRGLLQSWVPSEPDPESDAGEEVGRAGAGRRGKTILLFYIFIYKEEGVGSIFKSTQTLDKKD